MPRQRFRFLHFIRPIRRGWNYVSGGKRRPPLRIPWHAGRADFDRLRARTAADSIRRGNARPAFAGLARARLLLEVTEGEGQPCGAAVTTSYAAVLAPSALGGLVTRSPLSDSSTVRCANGFSHSKAMNAAARSQTIIAQKTFVHEPVLANSQAAPGPAKPAATPFAVYTIP